MSKQLQQQENRRKQHTQNKYTYYIKYSGLTIQMMVIIFGGTYCGVRLDKYMAWKFPLFTVVLALLSVVFAVWYVVRAFLK